MEKQTPKVSKGAWIRTVVLAVALLNQVLVSFGKSPLPFNEANVELVVSLVFTGVATVVAWWKDNDFTLWARKNKKPNKK